MYYVENTRANYTRTIGCAVTRTDAKRVIEREKERLKNKNITKLGEFVIRNERGERIVMRVKNSRNTWDKKEFAESGYRDEL